MFCFQCEQTAGCKGCAGKIGVCGKNADTAEIQDKLTGSLIGLARATEGNEHMVSDSTAAVIVEGLFATLTNVNFDNDALLAIIGKVDAEKQKLVPECYKCASSCGRNNEYDMRKLWNADEDIRSLKSLILFGIRGVAAYAYHAAVLGYKDESIHKFLYKALFAIGMDDWGMEELLPIVLEVGEVNLKCMAMLDKANTETFYEGEGNVVAGYDEQFVASIMNIKLENRTRKFAAIGYVQLTLLDGSFFTVYSYDNQNMDLVEKYATTLEEVATNALEQEGWSEDERAMIADLAAEEEKLDIDTANVKDVRVKRNQVYFTYVKDGKNFYNRLTYDGANGWRLQTSRPSIFGRTKLSLH